MHLKCLRCNTQILCNYSIVLLKNILKSNEIQTFLVLEHNLFTKVVREIHFSRTKSKFSIYIVKRIVEFVCLCRQSTLMDNAMAMIVGMEILQDVLKNTLKTLLKVLFRLLWDKFYGNFSGFCIRYFLPQFMSLFPFIS